MDTVVVTVDGGPEVSTVGATVVEDERNGTVVQEVDRGHWDTDDGDGSVMELAAVIVCVTLFVVNRDPPAA